MTSDQDQGWPNPEMLRARHWAGPPPKGYPSSLLYRAGPEAPWKACMKCFCLGFGLGTQFPLINRLKGFSASCPLFLQPI